MIGIIKGELDKSSLYKYKNPGRPKQIPDDFQSPRENDLRRASQSEDLELPLPAALTKRLFPGRIVAMPIVKTPTYPHKVTAAEIIIGIEARGSIQKIRTYQMATLMIGGDPETRRRVQLQYPYHAPVQPNSQAQLDRRQAFTNGMTAWAALTPGEKEVWNQKAALEYRERSNWPGSFRPHSGCNLFMRDYLLAH